MASPLSDIGTGATVGFGTSSFAPRFNELNWEGIERPVIPAPYLALAVTGSGEIGNLPKLLGDVIDAGRVSGVAHFNPDTVPPIDEDPEVITITWRSGATWVFTGQVVAYNPKIVIDGLMTADVTIEACSKITVTAG